MVALALHSIKDSELENAAVHIRCGDRHYQLHTQSQDMLLYTYGDLKLAPDELLMSSEVEVSPIPAAVVEIQSLVDVELDTTCMVFDRIQARIPIAFDHIHRSRYAQSSWLLDAAGVGLN